MNISFNLLDTLFNLLKSLSSSGGDDTLINLILLYPDLPHSFSNLNLK